MKITYTDWRCDTCSTVETLDPAISCPTGWRELVFQFGGAKVERLLCFTCSESFAAALGWRNLSGETATTNFGTWLKRAFNVGKDK